MEESEGALRGRGGKKENPPEEEIESPARRSYVVYQGMGAASIGFGAMVSSMAMGYTSPALPSMRAEADFHISPEQESWVGAVMPLAGLAGSLMAGPLVDHFGRRTMLLHLNWPFCLSWALVAMAGDVGGVLLGRVLCGFCVGMQAVVGTVYMPETIQVDLRSTLAAFPIFFGTLGMLMSFAVGQILSWRDLAWVGSGLCLLPIPLLFLLPETPQHLTRTGQPEASLKALCQLRASAKVAEEEQEEINASVSRRTDQNVSIRELAQAPNLWPVGVAVCLMMAQQTTGINAVVFFASTILAASGEALAARASVFLGVINFLGTFVGVYFMAKCKRRDSLLWSTYGVVTSLVALAAFSWAREAGGHSLELANSFNLVPVVALVVYMLSFSVGWGPVPWVFVGEGMPSQARGRASAIVVSVNWGFAFVVTKTFGWSIASLGSAATFLLYAVMTIAAITFLHPTMPETFQRSAAEMDKMYLHVADKKQQ